MPDPIPTLTLLSGPAILEHVPDLARLRIAVFREWPYLYEGDLDYERRYLTAFCEARSATLVLVRDGEQVVGASTAVALAEELDALRAPFTEAGLDVGGWFYLAESVLLPEYRGRGLGHAFFDARERAGATLGFDRFAFCAVVRAGDDPHRPKSYRELDPFWKKRGYEPSQLVATLGWRCVGEPVEREHMLRFWLKQPSTGSWQASR